MTLQDQIQEIVSKALSSFEANSGQNFKEARDQANYNEGYNQCRADILNAINGKKETKTLKPEDFELDDYDTPYGMANEIWGDE